jgi:glycosyltransferase involved in cell wall biosynthesis
MISCIITCYNQSKYIEEAIRSIINQTYRDLEIIIVDDASTDGSRNIIEKFKDDSRVVTIFRDTNSGLPAIPRNDGIRKAQGQFIAFLDGDDYWATNKLEEQLTHVNDDIIGVGSTSTFFDNKKLLPPKTRIMEDTYFDFGQLLMINNVIFSSLLVRNSEIFFNEDPAYKYVEDWDYQLQLTQKSGKKIKLIASPLLFSRLHDSNGSSSPFYITNQINLVEHYKKFLTKTEIVKLDTIFHFYLGKQYLVLKQTKKCRKHFLKSISSSLIHNPKLMKSILGIAFSTMPNRFQQQLIESQSIRS